MKTKNNFLLIISIISCSFFFASCDDDNGDTTSPTINLISPQEGAVLEVGSKISFEAEFSDNEKLASYKVNIHNNFNGHTHKSALHSDDETVDFAYDNSWAVTKKQNVKVAHQEIMIPENATHGKYHLVVYCVDASGNESHVARNIVVGSDDDDDHDHEE